MTIASLRRAQTILDHLSAGSGEGNVISDLSKPEQVFYLYCMSRDYRSGALSPEDSPDFTRYGKMKLLAEKWKRDVKLYKDTSLEPHEIKKILKVCRYTKFTDFVINYPEKRVDLFKWALRDNNKVAPYIEFIETCAKLKKCYISIRLGRFARKMLKFERSPKKDLKILMEGKYVSILSGEEKVTFAKGWTLTVNQVFAVFQQVNSDPWREANLEFFEETGITNWNGYELGRIIPETKKIEHIDVLKKEWWKQIPIFETLKKGQLMQRLGLKDLPDGQWVFVIKASRAVEKLDLMNSHGYLQVAIPTDDGKYHIYDFGKFPLDFPLTMSSQVGFFGNTVEARIACPDCNAFMTIRQHAGYPRIYSPEDANKIMTKIGQDIQKGRDGNLILQFSGENCAFWPQQLFESMFGKTFPNIFRVYVPLAEPSVEPLHTIFNFVRLMPKFSQPLFILLCQITFFAWRGKYIKNEKGEKEWMSLWTSLHFQQEYRHLLYVPPLLHKKIEQGELPGVITMGHPVVQKVNSPLENMCPRL